MADSWFLSILDCATNCAQNGPLRLANRDLNGTHNYRGFGTIVFKNAPASSLLREYRIALMNLNRPRTADFSHRETHEGLDILLSLDEAMDVLGIGRTLLYKQMSNGELPWVQIGSTRHIRRVDLIDFIERNRKGGRRVA